MRRILNEKHTRFQSILFKVHSHINQEYISPLVTSLCQNSEFLFLLECNSTILLSVECRQNVNIYILGFKFHNTKEGVWWPHWVLCCSQVSFSETPTIVDFNLQWPPPKILSNASFVLTLLLRLIIIILIQTIFLMQAKCVYDVVRLTQPQSMRTQSVKTFYCH